MNESTHQEPSRDDYVDWPYPSPLLTAIGGFQQHRDDHDRVGFLVDEYKVNTRGFLHAGAIAAIADVAIGHALAATTDPPTRLVTINLSCDIIGTAARGQWVDVVVEPVRLGRRLAAGSAILSTDRTLATVTALFVPTD